MKAIWIVLGSALLLAGCSRAPLAFLQEDNHRVDIAIEELRTEVADLKHTLHGTQVALQLLEEREKKAQKPPARSPELAQQIATLSQKVAQLEKLHEKISSHASQSQNSFSQLRDKMRELENEIARQNRRLDEVAKLKNTLTSLSQALKNKNAE